MKRVGMILLIVLSGLLGFEPPAIGGSDSLAELVHDRLAEDPADPEALLAMADFHEGEGRRRHARRYLRAFMNLVYRHPRRPEAATRLAALRPANPFVLLRDDREDQGTLLYRNAIDGQPAVLVPAGPYRRRLVMDDATVVFDVDLPEYLIDLHETPASVMRSFLWEGGFEAASYWGSDGLAWIAMQSDRLPHWWSLTAGAPGGNYPVWGPTYFEARAVARWAGKRIPTEAEWEKAARGGIHLDGPDQKRPNPRPERKYPWGDEPVVGPDGSYRANLNCVVPARGDDQDDRDLPVDSLPEGASPYGCLHMAGNVTEWNEDRWITDEERFKLPRRSPFASKTSREKDNVRPVRGGYFNEGLDQGEIDERMRRSFASDGMCLLFKAGLRSAANAPPADAGPDVGALTDEPDPLDAERFYQTAVEAIDDGEPVRAYRFARAALRLVRSGPFRARLLLLVHQLRPEKPWVKEAGGFRNLIDGKLARRVGKLRADRFEVTEGDLLRFAAEGGYELDEYWGGMGREARHAQGLVGAMVNVSRLGAGNLPAVTIHPREAQAYARWAGKRLPSVEEWNRLAGRGKRKYPWGDDKPTLKERLCACREAVPEVEHSEVDDRVPVGSFPEGATPQGLLDLYGSVGEWVTGDADPKYTWPGSWGLFGGGTNHSLAEIRKDPDSIHGEDSTSWHYRMGFRCVADR